MWPFRKKADPIDYARLRRLAAEQGTTEAEMHEHYARLAEMPESEEGGPLLAGRLKYAEQVKRHGQ